jgi:geranylgeranyl pyrophosphate synthase
VIASHAGVIAPLVAGLRFGGAPAALELVAQEWGGAFGVAMQGLDDVMDLIGDPMNTGKDSFQDFRSFHAACAARCTPSFASLGLT